MVVHEVLNLLSFGLRIFLSDKETREINNCRESSPCPVLSLVERSNPDSVGRGCVLSDKGGQKNQCLILPLANIITRYKDSFSSFFTEYLPTNSPVTVRKIELCSVMEKA